MGGLRGYPPCLMNRGGFTPPPKRRAVTGQRGEEVQSVEDESEAEDDDTEAEFEKNQEDEEEKVTWDEEEKVEAEHTHMPG